MGQLKFPTATIDKLLDEQYQTPIQDCVGNNYTQAAPLNTVANTPYTFEVNGATRNAKFLPAHITNIWDTVNNRATFAEFINVPEIVANVQFTFEPTNAQAGTITLDVYVNEAVPVIMKSYTVSYKAETQRYTVVSTFYASPSVGFDVKTKGVFFRVRTSGAGKLYDTAIEIYKT